MSRAESPIARPHLGGAVRSAAIDLFYHSWRLVPANALVAGTLALLAVVWVAFNPVLALIAAPLLALPVAGATRLAGFIARGEEAVLSDVWSGGRAVAWPAICLGTALAVASFLFATNVVVGLGSGELLGWSIAVLAAWGLLGTWVYALLAWPILVDPWRRATRVRDRLRLAALLGIAFPLRLVGFGLALAVFLALSTLLFALLATVSVAFTALVACRYVLPAADRLSLQLNLASPTLPVTE